MAAIHQMSDAPEFTHDAVDYASCAAGGCQIAGIERESLR